MRPTLIIGIAFIGLAIGGGCRQSAAERPPAPPPRVTVAYPEVRELTDYDEYNGYLEASATVEVRSRVRGHIKEVHFQDGDNVDKDQLLFELDPRPFESEIDRAKDTLHIAEAQHVAALKEEARLKELLTKGGASKSQVEKAEADARSLEAQIAASQEEVERRELDLEYSRVVAEIPGRISRAQLTAGNLVNAGGSDPLLTTIVRFDPVYVYFRIDERALQRYIKLGVSDDAERVSEKNEAPKLPFQFALDTDEGFPHQATLNFTDNRLDRNTGTIEVRGEATNRDRRLVPGSRAKIRVPVGKPYSALLIPDAAILSDQDRKYALLINDENLVVRRDLTLGRLLDDGQRVVLKGLAADEPLLVDGIQRARIDYPVEPLDAEAKPFERKGSATKDSERPAK